MTKGDERGKEKEGRNKEVNYPRAFVRPTAATCSTILFFLFEEIRLIGGREGGRKEAWRKICGYMTAKEEGGT